METCRVLGTPLAVTDYAVAVEQTKAWALTVDAPRLIAAANTHVVTLARTDSTFRSALARFDLILPDGMPLVWVMNRQLATPLRDRVYGPTFMLECLAATQGEAFSHFLLGGTEELLADLRARLLTRFPQLQVAGTYAPPFRDWSETDDKAMILKITEARPRFVWVGLGCPKQELWLARVRDRLPPAVYGAVGAAFAFHAGRVPQAPLWTQRIGCEWIFRFIAEPRRLWRRYLVFNSLFLLHLAKDALLRRRSE